MPIKKTLLASLILSSMASANAEDLSAIGSWEGPYVGIILGASKGDNRLQTGAGNFSGSDGGGLGTCVNTSSGSIFGSAGQSTLEQCEGKNSGNLNPPHVWTANDTIVSSNLLQNVASSNKAKFTGGFKVGYNWQRDNLVYGIEADWTKQRQEKLTSSATSSLDENTITTSAQGELGIDWLGTVRGRLGIAVSDALLPYVTAGYAYGNVDTRTDVTYIDSAVSGTTSRRIGDRSNESGWTAGLGMDYRLNKNFLVGLSYLYVDLGGKNSYGDIYTAGTDDTSRSGAASVNTDSSFHTIRLGLNYAF